MSLASQDRNARDASLENTGKCAMDSIRYMMAALNVDYDRLAELQDLKSQSSDADQPMSDEDATELEALLSDADDCESREDAEQIILEDPLSLEFRSGWATNKSELVAEEYCLLLSTGGPATRIIGDLDEHGMATSARLQVQDWGTPWTEHFPVSEDRAALLAYAQVFCPGE
jgi:hypothetical protein